MITLCALPKAFKGEYRLIQENALKSWLALRPTPQIILFGTDRGVKEYAHKYRVTHIPHVKKNRFGTPLLDDLFFKAEKMTKGSLTAYVNADIILLSDFMTTIRAVEKKFSHFVLGGQRYNADIDYGMEFNNKKTELDLKKKYAHVKYREGPSGIDYFVFTKDAFGTVPEFAVGRTFWDKWLLYRALQRKIPLIDASDVVNAIHQNHSYAHATGGAAAVWEGPEAKENIRLAGGWGHGATLMQANYHITSLRPFKIQRQKGSNVTLVKNFFLDLISKASFLYPVMFKIRRFQHITKSFMKK